MHEDAPYDLVQPPQWVSVGGRPDALLLARWRDRALVLTSGQVSWVASAEVAVDWAPWSQAIAANA